MPKRAQTYRQSFMIMPETDQITFVCAIVCSYYLTSRLESVHIDGHIAEIIT